MEVYFFTLKLKNKKNPSGTAITTIVIPIIKKLTKCPKVSNPKNSYFPYEISIIKYTLKTAKVAKAVPIPNFPILLATTSSFSYKGVAYYSSNNLTFIYP